MPGKGKRKRSNVKKKMKNMGIPKQFLKPIEEQKKPAPVAKKMKSVDPITLSSKEKPLRFKGCTNFRMRLVCATLAGKSIRIDDIRPLEESPGIQDHEACFLRLLDKISNGCTITINETGTSLKYTPGLLSGGVVTHDCPPSRSVCYHLEALALLAPFCKYPIEMTLTGVTNESKDLSIDILRTMTLPLFKTFGLEVQPKIETKKRGAPPGGGGEVHFTCPIITQLKPINLVDMGKIKRIRGVAYTTKCSPQFGNRMIDTARGVFNDYIPDVHIYADHNKGKVSGNSAGFGISLVAESTTGVYLSADNSAVEGTLPEDLGKKTALALMNEISQGGCVDSAHQAMMLLYMLLCPEDVSKIRLGKLAPFTIECLRLYKEIFGVSFKIVPDANDTTLLLSCMGIGYKNYSRKSA